MEKKEIQDQRMRRYFIEAAKEIIKGEGIGALTVRNVADRAGYSYATLYNYFKDIRKLIFEALVDFLDECSAYMLDDMQGSSPGEQRIRQCAFAYVKFFVQYPSIFQLAMLDTVGKIAPLSSNLEIIGNVSNIFLLDDWKIWANECGKTEDVIETASLNYCYVINGMLLFYMNRQLPATFSEFLQTLNNQLDFILKR